MNIAQGQSLLLREGNIARLVYVVQAFKQRANGTQELIVRDCDQFGRAKERRVLLGSSTKVEEVYQ